MIDLSRPRYDQDSYQGRLLHFIGLTWPGNLLVTDEELAQYQSLLASFNKEDSKGKGNFDEEELWHAKTGIRVFRIVSLC